MASRLMASVIILLGHANGNLQFRGVNLCLSCVLPDKAWILGVLLSAARQSMSMGKMFVLVLACLPDRDLEGTQ